MSERPEIALSLSNLDVGLDFFVNRLGFTLQHHQPDEDMASVLDFDGDLILFVGPKVENAKAHLGGVAFVIKPGETIRLAETDLEARRVALLAHGISDIATEETATGDRMLSVRGPDNYRVVFVFRTQRSPEELLELYEKGSRRLEHALAGLSEADLDLAREPGQWSIRQIVHHLAEGEGLYMPMIKIALAQSGATYVRNPYNQETWPGIFNYTGRPVASSVALIAAMRTQILELLSCVPDSWEQYVMMRTLDENIEGRKITVGSLISGMARHMVEHCEEIQAIRQAHGLKRA